MLTPFFQDNFSREIMKTRLILKPGQKGTGRLVSIYGDRPVCVRYRI